MDPWRRQVGISTKLHRDVVRTPPIVAESGQSGRFRRLAHVALVLVADPRCLLRFKCTALRRKVHHVRCERVDHHPMRRCSSSGRTWNYIDADSSDHGHARQSVLDRRKPLQLQCSHQTDRNLLRQETAFFDSTETGVLLSRLNNNVNKIGSVALRSRGT